MLTVRLGNLQLAALQCHSQAFDETAGEPMPGTVRGGTLTFDATERDALLDYLRDVSNSADAQYEEERRKLAYQRDRTAMVLDRKMREAVDRLSERVRGARAA